jgi:hypothetical protein
VIKKHIVCQEIAGTLHIKFSQKSVNKVEIKLDIVLTINFIGNFPAIKIKALNKGNKSVRRLTRNSIRN